MGIFDALKKAVSSKVEDIDKAYNPVRKATEMVEKGFRIPGGPPDPQAAYEAKERAAQAPYERMKKVDNDIKKKAF